ncbi:MAG: DUF2235 domain-containing protein [Gammaproteobacteria bacterium]|nr:DUF2235 domain-containing protein [Gammaproteobacteria bacterium]
MTQRRLIVCFDGTWNEPDKGENPTNVVKLVRAIKCKAGDVSQITFYDKGVGTGGPLDRIAGGASGEGLTRNMIDGYRFIANNYEDGDEIYAFGFSRGAYTARSLVGFIGLAGIISPLALGSELRKAIEIYRHEELNRKHKLERMNALDREFVFGRKTGVPIRCIGVWDTVGALGIPGDLGRRLVSKNYFHDVQLSDKVEVALHAIAIDEKRGAFAPTLWVRKKGDSPPPGQTVEQVWFCGVHSNVGGSYVDAGLSDLALDWLIKRVHELTGLEFDQQYMADHVRPDAYGKGVESRTALYLGSKLYPYQRLIGQTVPEAGGFGGWFRKTFSVLDRRYEPPDGSETINEMLHVAALERWAKPVVWDCPEDEEGKPRDYRPVNLAAVIRAHHGGRLMPVVDHDGHIMTPQAAPWPAAP